MTGAGRGIGRATAIALAAAGVERVCLVSRTRSQLETVAAEVERAGVAATVCVCDVTEPDEVGSLFGEDVFDLVVCSAGGNIPEPFVDVTAEHFDRLFELNVKGTFVVLQGAARRLLESGRPGTLIVVSSQMGHVGDANRTVYCATKHALEGLVRALAVELGPHEIRVVSVAPTFVRTEMTEPFFRDESFLAEVLSRVPLGELGEAEDVAATIAFLASPAARMITGTSVLVDGGWTAR